MRVAIACPWLSAADLAGVDNVERLKVRGTAELAAHYREADFVAVPMKNNLFSGITVAIEAAAIGTPVLASRTGGVPTYFSEDEVIFVPVGDPDAMRQAISAATPLKRRQIAERARLRYESSEYTSRGMAGRYTDFTRALLANAAEIAA